MILKRVMKSLGLRLPTPRELGKSKTNALPLRLLNPNTTRYTWEDWHEEVSTRFLVRYGIYEIFPIVFHRLVERPLEGATREGLEKASKAVDEVCRYGWEKVFGKAQEEDEKD